MTFKVNKPAREVSFSILLLGTIAAGCAPPGPDVACQYRNGTIVKYDGVSWSPQSSGTSCPLWGVAGIDTNNV